MKNLDSISSQDKKLPFTVPAGYFENLQERVMQRCAENPTEELRSRPLWSIIRSQMAVAAGFALLVGMATFATKFISAPQNLESVNMTSYISTFDIETYVEQSIDVEDVVEDQAIVEYLLCDNDVGYLAMEL